jgi:hypothetical protein
MKKNMGTVDRALRIAAALVVALLWYTGKISGTLVIVLGAFAVIFLLTSFVAWCPLYLPLGLSTRKE